MARDEGISELKTETFDGIKSIIESIIDYAANNQVDLIVIGTREELINEICYGKCGVVQHAHCPVLLVR
jgi:nucleotide-binding universal stress UspA family protein